MRTLIFLLIGLTMLGAMLIGKYLDTRREKAAVEKSESLTLSARLEQSADLYRTAANAVSDRHRRLSSAITELADHCSALSARRGFSRAARSTIIRLLLSLNDVVRRVTEIDATSHLSDSGRLLTDRAIQLIVEASEILEDIADRADDASLRRLESDLDVLNDHLSTRR